MGSDGHTYERKNIIAWLEQHGTSPMTREPMSIDSLKPNHVVRKIIDEFRSDTKEKEYQFRMNVDVRKTKSRPLFQAFGKAMYEAEWVGKKGPPIVLLKIDGAKARREATFYVRLSCHPHIVRTFGTVESDPNSVILVQEYAEKGDLSELLRDEGMCFKPSMDVLTEIFNQVIDAMICLADNQIVHGDLACRNVLVFKCDSNVVENNLVKLTDFGLTKASDLFSVAASSSRSTMTVIPVRYVAPEVLRTNGDRRSYTEKSDVYSMGVLMWEACSNGIVPFSSLIDDSEVGRSKLRGDQLPQPLICNKDLWTIISKCWNMEPSKRPTFRILQQEIKRFVHTYESVFV